MSKNDYMGEFVTSVRELLAGSPGTSADKQRSKLPLIFNIVKAETGKKVHVCVADHCAL